MALYRQTMKQLCSYKIWQRTWDFVEEKTKREYVVSVCIVDMRKKQCFLLQVVDNEQTLFALQDTVILRLLIAEYINIVLQEESNHPRISYF